MTPSPSPAPDIDPTPDPYTAHDADVLARTIYGEARGEGAIGMKAVACVVMNRVALAGQHPHFGDGTVAGACMAPWQFSCWNAIDPNAAIINNVGNDDMVFMAARSIAMATMAGIVEDMTGSATYYYAVGTTEPAWAEGKTPCAQIGKHIFFKDIA